MQREGKVLLPEFSVWIYPGKSPKEDRFGVLIRKSGLDTANYHPQEYTTTIHELTARLLPPQQPQGTIPQHVQHQVINYKLMNCSTSKQLAL